MQKKIEFVNPNKNTQKKDIQQNTRNGNFLWVDKINYPWRVV